jgi:hypothetical protein
MSRLEISRDTFLSCLGPKLKSLGLEQPSLGLVLDSWSWQFSRQESQDKQVTNVKYYGYESKF